MKKNFSKTNEINSGVPQGGISSPDLFNITLKYMANIVSLYPLISPLKQYYPIKYPKFSL